MDLHNPSSRRRIFDRTNGKCHICGKKLAFINYAQWGAKGAWEIEHSNPRARGGTDHANNLFAAHMKCNRSKRDCSTRNARAKFGRTRAPLSAVRRKSEKAKATLATAGLFAAVGGAIGGPPGAWIGGSIGALIGSNHDPDK
jgi:5-methylcytosine-specific restriction endonuclease McrA